MKKYVILTRTMWNEPPRIRHQLTRLLEEYNQEVIFVEKPLEIYRKKTDVIGTASSVSKKIKTIRFYELIHHRLKFLVLRWLDSILVANQIRKILNDGDVIINFNYDYYFLKKFFSRNKIITIINDDFEAQGKLLGFNVMKSVLIMTLKNSDLIYSTSSILVERYIEYIKKSKKVKLLLPWHESVVCDNNKKRDLSDRVVCWGYVTHRIDFDLIEYLLKRNVKIDLCGPALKREMTIVCKLIAKYPIFFYRKHLSLEEVAENNYYACLTPYKFLEETKTICVTNKAYQMLGIGVPIVNHGLPNFIGAECISNCSNYQEVFSALQSYLTHSERVMASINNLLKSNDKTSRYLQIRSEFDIN